MNDGNCISGERADLQKKTLKILKVFFAILSAITEYAEPQKNIKEVKVNLF